MNNDFLLKKILNRQEGRNEGEKINSENILKF
jgi:hypothetical protein